MNLKKIAGKLGRGVKNELTGALKNMGPSETKKRYAEMDASQAENRASFIRENFGNEERYRDIVDPNDSRFVPTYQKVGKGIGSFVERLANARKTAVEAGKGAGSAIKKGAKKVADRFKK